MSRSPADPSWRPERIVVGRVGRPHGLDGAVHLEGHGGTVPLEAGARVEVGGREAVILERRGLPDRPILRLDVASDRDEAAALRGEDVAVPVATLPTPEEGEYFHVDLIGCRARCAEEDLGVVTAVLPYPANDVLEVRPADGGTSILVPFVEQAILSVDVPGRVIEIRPGFL